MGLSFLLSSHGVIGYTKSSQDFIWRDANEPSSFLFLIRIKRDHRVCCAVSAVSLG